MSVLIPFSHAGSRRDTAVLLVGTAREFGINQRDIRPERDGYRISQALADVLYDESQDEPIEEPKAPSQSKPKTAKKKSSGTTKKTSDNRVAKNTGTSRTEQE